MHVVMMVMVVVMVMMVVMHLVHFASGRGGHRSGFLRDGVAGEADRESGGREKALHHGRTSFGFTDRCEPAGGNRAALRLNST
jgi:hypothetical protein